MSITRPRLPVADMALGLAILMTELESVALVMEAQFAQWLATHRDDLQFRAYRARVPKKKIATWLREEFMAETRDA